MKILLIIGLIFSSFAMASEGHDGGNGGGGIYRDGRYQTFFSAGFYTDLYENQAYEVPGLEKLTNFFYTSNSLDSLQVAKLVSALAPSNARRYFKVKKEHFTQEVRNRLREEYQRVTSANSNELALFAITDTSSQTTYLLPEFYELNEIEQMTILFHEAYWIINPNYTYRKVVEAEIAFQASFEDPESVDKSIRFIEAITQGAATIRTIFGQDVENGSLDRLFYRKTNNLPLFTILGEEWLKCHQRNLQSQCDDLVSLNLYKISRSNPRSNFLRYLYTKASQNKIKVIYGFQWDNVEIKGAEMISLKGSGLTSESDLITGSYSNSKCDAPNRKDKGAISLENLDSELMIFDGALPRSRFGKPGNWCSYASLIILK